jgi:hypothetical protein
MESVKERHGGVRRYVLIIDDWEGWISPGEEPFEVVRLQELGIPGLESLCFKYGIMELATAVKPHLFRFLLAREECAKLLYLDPDIYVTGSLSGLFEGLSRAEVVVIPHLDRDFPDDGLQPDDKLVLTGGIFNLGFLGLKRGEGSGRFLEWWAGKLWNKCLFDLGRGLFVDQKYVDMAFFFFDGFLVERSPGYDVA